MGEPEPSQWVSLSVRLYRRLLALYPAAYRREYGPWMVQAFRDLCRAAYRQGGAWRVGGLWLRTLADTLATAAAERLAVPPGRQPAASLTPLSWPGVGLSVLPGLLVLVTTGVGVRLLAPFAHLLPPGLLGIVAFARGHGLAFLILVPLAVLAGRRRLPVWSLALLGALFGLGVAGLFLLLGLPALVTAALACLLPRRGPLAGVPRPAWLILAALLALCLLPMPPFAGSQGPTAFLALASSRLWSVLGVGATLAVVALGLPLARRHGLAAAVFVAATGFALWAETCDLTYGLAGTFWGEAMIATLALFLLVVSPLWLLRARSRRGQACGLLLPAAVALTVVVAINAMVRTAPALLIAPARLLLGATVSAGPALDQGISVGSLGAANLLPLLLRDGTTVLQLLLSLAFAAVLYPWIERWGGAEARAQGR